MSTTLIDRLLDQGASEQENEADAAIVIARPPREEHLPWTARQEGELAVDVYQEEDAIAVVAVIGGVSAEDIAVEIHHDVVTIRGERRHEDRVPYARYLTQECYWGPFSRSVVLPVEVRADVAVARFRQGVLTITLPKAMRAKAASVPIMEEDDAL